MKSEDDNFERVELIMKVVFRISAAILLVFAAKFTFNTKSFLDGAQSVEGEAISNESYQSRCRSSSSSYTCTKYRTNFRILSPNDNDVISSIEGKYEIKTRLQLLYNKDDAKPLRLKNQFHYLIPLVLLVIVAVELFVILPLIIKTLRKQQKNRAERTTSNQQKM